MLQIYFGDGKGKTTAAIGSAVRAMGHNYKILFTQFLKCDNTGERIALGKIHNITLTPCPNELKFVFDMNDDEKLMLNKQCLDLFNSSVNTALTQKYDMIIFDEILTAIKLDVLPESEVFSFLTNAPANMEIICTGCAASEKLVSIADYVSHIEKIKHPYDNGIEARSGIEF